MPGPTSPTVTWSGGPCRISETPVGVRCVWSKTRAALDSTSACWSCRSPTASYVGAGAKRKLAPKWKPCFVSGRRDWPRREWLVRG
jgi:hypothetical protein